MPLTTTKGYKMKYTTKQYDTPYGDITLYESPTTYYLTLDKLNPKFDERYSSYESAYSKIDNRTHLPKDLYCYGLLVCTGVSNVLQYGTGLGTLTNLYELNNINVTSLEINPVIADLARQLTGSNNIITTDGTTYNIDKHYDHIIIDAFNKDQNSIVPHFRTKDFINYATQHCNILSYNLSSLNQMDILDLIGKVKTTGRFDRHTINRHDYGQKTINIYLKAN